VKYHTHVREIFQLQAEKSWQQMITIFVLGNNNKRKNKYRIVFRIFIKIMILNVRAAIPTLDAAVKIAQALGVSVEYLATGKESPYVHIPMSSEIRNLLQNYNLLNEEDRKIVTEFVESLMNEHGH
jgi:hypothetical protein